MKNILKPIYSILITLVIVAIILLPMFFMKETGRKENCEPIYPFWVWVYMGTVQFVFIYLLLDFVKKHVSRWFKINYHRIDLNITIDGEKLDE